MIDSAEEFVRLRTSDSREDYLRASKEGAPVEVWLKIISDYPEMKEWVVHNKTVSIEILHLLTKDHDPLVRAAIADKRKLTPQLFNILSHDLEELVRQRLAHNKNTPKIVMQRLVNDENAHVRAAALKRLRKL